MRPHSRMCERSLGTEPKTVPHYSRAPVAEAVIDLQVSFDESGPPSMERLGELADAHREVFTQRQAINAVSMAVSSGGVTKASHEEIGLRLNSASGDRVLQLRRLGISLSHLQPYSSWEQFSAETRPLWEQYRNAFRPMAVTRMAVRYINKISVAQSGELDAFLNLSPRTVEGMAMVVEGYFMQMVLPQADLGAGWKAIINSGIEGASAPDAMTILLDIDVYCTESVPADAPRVWEILGQLRDRKNKIFEACITDEVRRLIQ
jgi:uncharacterized protein (TIGR04255 family)